MRVACGDGRDGHASAAPYDRVIATVSTPTIPLAWRDQLVDGGLLELPLQLGRADLQVVATFRREGDRLESVAVVAGGFMPLRGLPRDAPRASSRATAEGRSSSSAGRRVGALSRPARRRLLAAALGRPRRVPLGGPVSRFVARALARARAAGVAARVVAAGRHRRRRSRGGRGLALADVALDAAATRGPTRSLLAFGEGDAEDVLLRAIEARRRRGAPAESDLRLAVDFDGGTARVSRSWRRD